MRAPDARTHHKWTHEYFTRALSTAARTAPDFQMTVRRRERCIDCSYFPRDEASDEQRIIIHARAQYFDAPDFHHNLSQRRSQLYMERGERNFAGCVCDAFIIVARG